MCVRQDERMKNGRQYCAGCLEDWLSGILFLQLRDDIQYWVCLLWGKLSPEPLRLKLNDKDVSQLCAELLLSEHNLVWTIS